MIFSYCKIRIQVIEGCVCANVLHEDVQDHVEGPWEGSTNEELEELVESSTDEEDEKLK